MELLSAKERAELAKALNAVSHIECFPRSIYPKHLDVGTKYAKYHPTQPLGMVVFPLAGILLYINHFRMSLLLTFHALTDFVCIVESSGLI